MRKLLLTMWCCLLTVVGITLILSNSAFAANYWIDGTNGSNGNGCNASGSPLTTTAKQTVAAGLACLSSGDTLSIRTGTYAELILSSQVPSGTSYSAATTVKGHTGETVTLRPTSGGAVISFATDGSDHRYIIFENLVFDGSQLGSGTNTAQIGGGANGGAIDHIKFVNVDLKDPSSGPGGGNTIAIGGVDGAGTDVWITNSKVRNAGCGSSGSPSHNIYVQTSNNIVEYTEISNAQGYGIHQFSVNPTNNTYRYNSVHNNGQNGCSNSLTAWGVLVTTAGNNSVYGNLVYNNMNGITVSSSGNLIYNNTVYGNGVGFSDPPCCYEAIKIDGGSGNVVKNNLVIGNQVNSIDTTGSSGTTASNNVTSGSAESIFVTAGSANFSLLAGASPIDAGTASIASGITRCANGSAPDVGAIEILPQPTATVNGTAFTITQENNCTSQMLPATSVTGFSVRRNGAADAFVGAVNRTSSNVYAGTLTNAFSAGHTCTFSYSSIGNATSDNNIGNLTTSNQEIFDFTDQACTNTSTGAPALVRHRSVQN